MRSLDVFLECSEFRVSTIPKIPNYRRQMLQKGVTRNGGNSPVDGNEVNLAAFLFDFGQEFALPVQIPGTGGAAYLDTLLVIRPELFHVFASSGRRAHVGLATDIGL